MALCPSLVSYTNKVMSLSFDLLAFRTVNRVRRRLSSLQLSCRYLSRRHLTHGSRIVFIQFTETGSLNPALVSRGQKFLHHSHLVGEDFLMEEKDSIPARSESKTKAKDSHDSAKASKKV